MSDTAAVPSAEAETILGSVVDAPDRSYETSYMPGEEESDSEDEGRVQSSTRVLAIALAIVVVVVLVYHLARPQTLDAKLSSCGWVLYTRKGCGACTRQMSALGGDYSRRVDCNVGGTLLSSNCDQAPFTCSEIPAYPFWYNLKSKEVRQGLQPYNSLITMASS